MDAFTALYERHYRDVYRFALFLTGDPDRSEDLAAETFLRALMAGNRIHEPTVRAYLFAITRNLYRDQLRRSRPRLVELDEQMQDDGQAGADYRTEQRSELRQVRGRLGRLAEGDRRALLLYTVRSLSYREIAARLGVSVAAVKSRIARARAALRGFPAEARKREKTS